VGTLLLELPKWKVIVVHSRRGDLGRNGEGKGEEYRRDDSSAVVDGGALAAGNRSIPRRWGGS